MEDIKLSNIDIQVNIAVNAELLKTFPVEIKEDIKGYPENRLTFGLRLPASGFYIRNAKGISLSNVSLTFPEQESRPAFVTDRVQGIELKDVKINGRKLSDSKKHFSQSGSEKINIQN